MPKINNSLCLNPNAIHLLFKLDYNKMKVNNLLFKKELIQTVMNPYRLERFYNNNNIDLYG